MAAVVQQWDKDQHSHLLTGEVYDYYLFYAKYVLCGEVVDWGTARCTAEEAEIKFSKVVKWKAPRKKKRKAAESEPEGFDVKSMAEKRNKNKSSK